MVRPLLRPSSKLTSTGPAAGQPQFGPSPSLRASLDDDATGGTAGAGVTLAEAAALPDAAVVGRAGGGVRVSAGVAVVVGRGSTRGAPSGLTTTPVAGSLAGGATRTTCPTSIRLGFSRLFQVAMSRQFWPDSSAMRMSVSPGLTV